MNFITVDIGSTFIKAGLFDIRQERQTERIKYQTPPKKKNSDAAYYENEAKAFVEIIKGIIHYFCCKYPDTSGILFSTQQHGCVICHPELEADTYISWQDTRCLRASDGQGKSYMQKLQEIFSAGDMECNGVSIKPALALCNLYTLFEESGLSRSSHTCIHTLGSYIIHALTGNAICHITNAAPMGFADIRKNEWRRDMLETLKLDFFQLPEITAQMKCCGHYREGDICLAVFPDVGDVQTSVYGTDAVTGDLVINIGTSGQLISITDQYVPGDYEIRPFYENNYCNVISRMPGGRNFDVQIDYIRDIGEKIFGICLEREEVWNRIHQLVPAHKTEGLNVDCGFYELPDKLADGYIRCIDHKNMKLQNVLWATAVDFGKKFKKYAECLWKETGFQGTVYFTGGAVLKNTELQKAIREEMGLSETICAADDEVFRGMQKLVLKCLERMEEDEAENICRGRSDGHIPVRDSRAQPAAVNADGRA